MEVFDEVINMAYRVPQQFGKAPLPPGLGEIKQGDTIEEPIDANIMEEMQEALPGEFGSSPTPRPRGAPFVPNPRNVGAVKVAHYKQLGAASGAKVSNFFQHPFTHLGVGTFAGLIIADLLPNHHVMGRLKHPASTLILTSLGTLGVLSVVHK